MDDDKIYRVIDYSTLILKDSGEIIKLQSGGACSYLNKDHKVRGRLKPKQCVRLREEYLIITKDNKVYLSVDKDGLCSTKRGKYDVPHAYRYESDSRRLPKDVINQLEEENLLSKIYINYYTYMDDYFVLYDEPEGWVKKNFDEFYWWYGYRTFVYVLLYDGEYDNQSLSNGQFYDIDEAGRFMHTVHKKAIKMYKKKYMK